MPYQTEEGRELMVNVSMRITGRNHGIRGCTVFFFAKSPEAPKTIIVVFSLNSIDLHDNGKCSNSSKARTKVVLSLHEENNGGIEIAMCRAIATTTSTYALVQRRL